MTMHGSGFFLGGGVLEKIEVFERPLNIQNLMCKQYLGVWLEVHRSCFT